MSQSLELKNLQKRNFEEILQKMSAMSGWGVLEDSELLALKSPIATPLVNLVWGEPNGVNIQKIQSFFSDHDYYWILTEQQKDWVSKTSYSDLFITAKEFPEMVLDCGLYTKTVDLPGIEVILVNSDKNLQKWADVAIATFQLNESEFKEVFYPLIQVAGCVPFLLLFNNQPAATALTYCGKEAAGIYMMSVKTEFRRKGLGTAAVSACLSLAKKNNIPFATLYASELGRLLYEKVGFKITQLLYEQYFQKTLE